MPALECSVGQHEDIRQQEDGYGAHGPFDYTDSEAGGGQFGRAYQLDHSAPRRRGRSRAARGEEITRRG